MLSETAARRIPKLIEVLKRVPERRFDMIHIIRGMRHPEWKKGLEQAAEGYDNPICDSAACAIGYLPAVFPTLCQWSFSGKVVIDTPQIYYQNFGAACIVLDIEEHEAEWLFLAGKNYPKYPITKQMVIDRLELFVYNPDVAVLQIEKWMG